MSLHGLCPPFRCDAWANLTKLPRPRCIWHPTTQVLSQVSNFSLMGAERRSERLPRLGEISMITQQHLASFKHADRDMYAREKVLNSAIISADISSGWEEYLEILDAFYADNVEVTDGTGSSAVFGKERARALLIQFLVPIHVMAEIGGLSVKIRESPIHGDTADETHSVWSVDLIGVSGRTCHISWDTLRRWADSRVVYERHYDHHQIGGPLTSDDLCLSLSSLADQRPS